MDSLVSRLSLFGLLMSQSCTPAPEPPEWRDAAFLLPDAGPSAVGSSDGSLPNVEPMLRDANEVALVDGGAAPSDAGALLPAAFKGYELYAWSEGGLLHFTLIVGTNRQKSLEEIVGQDSATAGALSPIQGVGSVALSELLRRVPQGTSVIFASLPGLPALAAEERATVEHLLANGGYP